MDGEIDDVIDAVSANEEARLLEQAEHPTGRERKPEGRREALAR